MRYLSILSAAACMIVGANSAMAQDAPVASKSTERGAQALQNVGHCMAEMRGDWAEEFVTIDPSSARHKTLSKRLMDWALNCNEFRRGLETSSLIFKGALAEGLLIRDDVMTDLATHTAYDPELPPLETTIPEDLFGFCVVRKAPDQVATLLQTPMTSDEELEALKALAPVMPTCVPVGQQPKFTREALRSVFAIAAYRLYAHRAAAAS